MSDATPIIRGSASSTAGSCPFARPEGSVHCRRLRRTALLVRPVLMLVVLALLHTIEIKGRTRRVVYADDRLSGSTPTRPNFRRCSKRSPPTRPPSASPHTCHGCGGADLGGGATAAGFWQRARLVRRPRHIERALTDNGACYRSRLWLGHARPHRRDPETHTPLPAPDRREGGASPPDPLSQASFHL